MDLYYPHCFWEIPSLQLQRSWVSKQTKIFFNLDKTEILSCVVNLWLNINNIQEV